jgi:YVTN family beta-propeller protein
VRPGTRRTGGLAFVALALALVAAACGRGSAEGVGELTPVAGEDGAVLVEGHAARPGPGSKDEEAGHGTGHHEPALVGESAGSADGFGGGRSPAARPTAAAAVLVEPDRATSSTAASGAAATVTPTTPPPAPAGPNLYAETTAGKLAPSVRDIPLRVYVPNSDENTLTVIDPATFTVIGKIPTGQMPHHVTPSWDLRALYVLNTAGNTIIPIDPRTAQAGAPIPVTDPYNLYFTPDGSTAIVVAERYRRLDLVDLRTWEVVASIPVPFAGVDHGDLSADGRYFYASCEFSGWVVKVDLLERRVVADRQIGAQPIDVRMAPDASVLYVADQARHGVVVVDPVDLHEIAFLPTGRGAHGLYTSRDTTKLYVSNRLGGSVSVIDLATNQVEATWTIPGGGSPDMGGVNPDGSQLWLSGRHHGEVYVFDTRTGQLITRIRSGAGAHGLAIFPQPGRFSLGHTGIYR